jgi:hypothetical protein
MAKLTLTGTGDPAEIADYLIKQIPANGSSTQLVDDVIHQDAEMFFCTAVFQKYYFRNNSYAGLTVVISGKADIITVEAIGSAGGQGIFNISYGAESNFTELVYTLLEPKGFRNAATV